MNILFLTLIDFCTIDEKNIYTDLLREFTKQGHCVFAISPTERRKSEKTHLVKDGNTTILKLRIGNTQKTNIVEKGISTVLIEPQFIAGIRKYFRDVHFDLVLYSTPPITFGRAIQYVKNRDHARTYLMLKDIFPQNAVDLGMMSCTGPKSIIWRYFRNKEKKLYSISDMIGCMSQANVDYVLKHNPELAGKNVEICPNAVEIREMALPQDEKKAMRQKYGLPTDRTIFAYGGNLGKPQGIPFLIDCLRAEQAHEKAFFLIVGDGTEFDKLQTFTEQEKPANVKLMKRLPKEDYDRLVASCDVGLIFLDHRFTIPNYPSRLLSYMQARLPVLCATDANTDIGSLAAENGYGLCCESNDPKRFCELVDALCEEGQSARMGRNAYDYCCAHYTSEAACEKIIRSIGTINENDSFGGYAPADRRHCPVDGANAEQPSEKRVGDPAC